MSCCVITVIKNEHQYLNEWIQYHLDIGVSHVFIFEDIGSESHVPITDKYKDRVTLLSVRSMFSDLELQEMMQLKISKNKNPQHDYLSKALLYVRDLNLYDWGFQIDVDEFITISDNESLDVLMDQYSSYDALLLQWRCYGASGYVHKPDYSVSMLDCFDKPAPDRLLCSPYPDQWSKRVIYNLHHYRVEFFNCVHQPKDICNFVNTRFERDRKTWCYDKIYLRHYITRSWEEYLWKKFERGYFMGYARNWNAFFLLNPDMNFIRQDLVYAIDNPVLVVLPYIQSDPRASELRLALQGWRKNCQFSYHFVVIGTFDGALVKEFDWVEFIPTRSLGRVNGQYNPHLDIQNKFKVAYEKFSDKYPGFIYMVDDNYAIRPFSLFDIMQTHYLTESFEGIKNAPCSFWKHDKWKTRQLLDSECLPHVNYTTHFPCYFNFKLLKKLWDRFNILKESYVPEDVYFNVYNKSRAIQVKDIRYGVWDSSYMGEKLNKALDNVNIKFVCNSVDGWSRELEESLEKVVN